MPEQVAEGSAAGTNEHAVLTAVVSEKTDVTYANLN